MAGCLRYLCNIRPDICYAVRMMNMFMSKLKWSHYQVTVNILRYVKGNLRHEILFSYGVLDVAELTCYSDLDWCGDRVDKRRTI